MEFDTFAPLLPFTGIGASVRKLSILPMSTRNFDSFSVIGRAGTVAISQPHMSLRWSDILHAQYYRFAQQVFQEAVCPSFVCQAAANKQTTHVVSSRRPSAPTSRNIGQSSPHHHARETSQSSAE